MVRLFALGFGGVYVITRSANILHVSDEVRWLAMIPAYALASTAVVGMACLFPRPVARSNRGALVTAAIGVPAAGMGGTMLLGSFDHAGFGPFGLVRMVSVLLLVDAILRHEALGLDVKIRWTVKQSTIAATFVGVFLVVARRAAQQSSARSWQRVRRHRRGRSAGFRHGAAAARGREGRERRDPGGLRRFA